MKEKVYCIFNYEEGKAEEVPLPKYAAHVCSSLDKETVEAKGECKYEPVFGRQTVKHNFAELIQSVKDVYVRDGGLPEALQETVGHFQEIEKDVVDWLDNDSPLGYLDRYLDVFAIRRTARRSIRSLANAYMRFTGWQPEFTQDEAIRFLRTRQTKTNSRKTYASYLRTFFKAQGIRRDDLPFEHDRIKVDEEDRPQRKTLPPEKVKHFIDLIKRSDSARAGFYGSLITTYGFRPIEMGRITFESIDTEKHILRVQTAKHGRERVHHIPEPIRPYLYEYNPEPVSDKQMPRLWHYICRDIGFRAPKGYGWYGIRHALFTRLANYSGVPAQAIDKWGGWQSGMISGAGMSNIYNAPDATDLMAIDNLILEKHPFLGFWNGIHE